MDKDVMIALVEVIVSLQKKFPSLTFSHKKRFKLVDMIQSVKEQYPHKENDFSSVMKKTFIAPDGWFLMATNAAWASKIILVSEVKRQGTNDKRKNEGKKKQALGNAIERLGKNLIGIRAIFKKEPVLPFVCFGHGCDFEKWSSILDRVVTMNEFFPLNKTFVVKNHEPFEPVSMYFRNDDRTAPEMEKIMLTIAITAVQHYVDEGVFAKD